MSRYPLTLPTDLKRDAEELAERQGVSLNQFISWAVAEKVGGLKEQLDDVRFPRIVYRRGSSGLPTPVLRGTAVRVQTVVVAHGHWQMNPTEIAIDYGLRPAQVEEALAFYAAHRQEIDRSIEEEERLEAAIG